MLKLTTAVLTIALAAASVLGQSQSAPTLRVVTEDPSLPSELFYGNVKIKPLRLRPGTNQPITINDADFFVSQHYIDFLNRFGDEGGLAYWTSRITQCGADQSCIYQARISVSAAFFVELEFQSTGYYVYRFYKGALGRQPAYAEFMPDRRQVVGGANLEAGKTAFAEAFVGRAAFQQKYPNTMPNDAFVDALLATVKQTSGVDLSGQRGSLIADLNGGKTRAQVVRTVIENPAFSQKEYNAAFVRMQYFGYLRRDPDAEGEAFWVNILNNKDANNYRGMVDAFITSPEYRERF